MSHRRILSQGNVPFSWEEKPGVSKFNHQKIPSSSSTNVVHEKHEFLDLGNKPLLLPPPPPSATPTPTRGSSSSSSLKGMIRDDPFMVAFVKCTKNLAVENNKTIRNNNGGGEKHHHHHQRKSCSVGLSSKKGNKFFLFCKNAFEDVEVDNFMKYSNLPPLPRTRIQSDFIGDRSIHSQTLL